MSLQVWLPLTRDLRQQGLSDVTMGGSPASWTDGKLGKAATWNGNNQYVIYNNSTDFNYTNNFSVATWIKPNYTSGSTQYAFTVGRADMGGYGYGLQPISTSNLRFKFGNGNYDIPITNNEWCHVVMTVGNNKVTIYKNGVLVNSNNMPSTIPTYSDGCGLGLGCFYYGGQHSQVYPFYGSLNDFRIYDHCLSPMEVKQISQGLVLHYPLNRQGWGQENLIPAKATSFLSTQNWEGTGWGANFINHSNLINIIEPGETYTFSYTYEVTAGQNGKTDFNRRIGFLFYSSTSDSYYRECYKYSAHFGDKGTVVTTITIPDTIPSDYCIIYYTNRYTDGSNDTVKYSNIKLEKGSIATPWSPAPSDTLADTMSLNSNIEYDTSGFNNNGTRTGTFSWTSDTPKYEVSQVFASGNNYIDCGASQEILPTDGLTVSLWTNYSTWGNPISCTEGGGWNFENSSGIQFPVHVADVGYKIANSGVATSTLQNGWHMLTGTFDKTNVKIYIDGVLKATTATSSTKGISYAANHCYIGAEAAGSTSIHSAALVGKLSDVRIYATALSADDVLSLYQNSAYIDSNRNVYGAVHSEV